MSAYSYAKILCKGITEKGTEYVIPSLQGSVSTITVWEFPGFTKDNLLIGPLRHQCADDVKSYYIRNFETMENFRKQGYGKKLLTGVLNKFHNCVVYLQCRKDMIPFYERFGFKETEPDAEGMYTMGYLMVLDKRNKR